PPGLVINADGSITGTATGPAEARYGSGWIRTVDGSGTIYGKSEITIATVSSFRPTDAQFFDIPDASPPDDPDDPDGYPPGTPPSGTVGTIYYWGNAVDYEDFGS